ncbi:MAG: hypothetical protein JST01_14155 [Cyanobacteria bacterium SZAS TMP-1]|nr:hypothetical protein [Cyanobacteria bacterium SZAS TMP-1]
MLDKSTDSGLNFNAEQFAASTKCSMEACSISGLQASVRPRDNFKTLDFSQDDIYGDGKKSLSADAERKMAADPDGLAIFKANMDLFAERAAAMQMPPSEVAAVYKNVDRLLQTQDKGLLSGTHRTILAEQIMEHAARPYGINQGLHDTCSFNALEVRTFDKDPGAAAALIADVALNGAYKTKQGTTYHINPVPHAESAWGNIYEGNRSHASEIFQVTAANIFADHENHASRLWNPNSPTVRVEQRRPSPTNFTGETYVAYHPHGRAELVQYTNPYEVTRGNARWLPETLTAITGKSEPGTFIARDTVMSSQSPNITGVASAVDLHEMLVKAKEENKFPITVFLYTGNEPFWSDDGALDEGGGHVVNITDFKPGTGPDSKSYALVDNSWHDGKDHGEDNPIKLNTLYNAMEHPDKSVPSLQEQAARARSDGSPDYGTELDILRIQSLYHMTSSEEFLNDFNHTLDDNFFQWINQLPPKEQVQTYHKLKVIQDIRFTGGDGSGDSGGSSGTGGSGGSDDNTP